MDGTLDREKGQSDSPILGVLEIGHNSIFLKTRTSENMGCVLPVF